jgi:hypothetical protein
VTNLSLWVYSESQTIFNREERMKRFAIGFTVLMFALGATQVLAVTTEQRYATITGTASGEAAGQCTEGYANQCPTSSCTCVQVSGAVVAAVSGQPNIAGHGTANLFLTFDNGASTGGDCTPFFGVAELTTRRAGKSVSETLNLNGVSCSPLTTANNPILGGFGISNSPSPVNGGKGFGKVTGFLDPSGSVSLRLHGPITE